jgi:hypothetical protein
MMYKSVVANSKKSLAFDAIEKAKMTAAAATTAVAAARAAVASQKVGTKTTMATKELKKDSAKAVAQGAASKVAADKLRKSMLDNAVKTQKAAAAKAQQESQAAINKVSAAKSTRKATGRKAAKSISEAKDVSIQAKKALHKLFSLSQGGKVTKAAQPKPTGKQPPVPPVNLEKDAHRWAAMEKKAAENAMKAIAANVRAVRRERAERQVAGAAIRTATRAHKKLEVVRSNEMSAKGHLRKALVTKQRRLDELKETKDKQRREKLKAKSEHRAKVAARAAKKVIRQQKRRVRTLHTKRRLAARMIQRAMTSKKGKRMTSSTQHYYVIFS